MRMPSDAARALVMSAIGARWHAAVQERDASRSVAVCSLHTTSREWQVAAVKCYVLEGAYMRPTCVLPASSLADMWQCEHKACGNIRPRADHATAVLAS